MQKRIISAILTLLLAGITAIADVNNIVIDSSLYNVMRQRLAEASNASDSLDLAINLFDLNFSDDTGKYGEIAYRLARNSGDMDKARMMIKLLSYTYQDDIRALEDLERRAEILPNGGPKRELLTFLALRKSYHEAYDLSVEQRNTKMKELASQYLNSEPTDDIYHNIRQLFELCIYMHVIFDQSTLLGKYYEKLGVMIESLPPHQTSLRNLYYTMAANNYSRQFLSHKAVEMDLKLIECLKNLRKSYIQQGRTYRTLDSNLYTAYSRILSNHSALSREDADKYYNEIKKITARNSRLAEQMNSSELPQTYYYMAIGKYDKALPLLKKHIDELANRKNAIYFNRAMMEAADAMSDEQAYKKAANSYIQLLEEYVNLKTIHNLAELAITYDLNEARANAEKLRDEQSIVNEANDHRRLLYALCSGVLFLLIAIIFMIQWRKKRKSSLELKALVNDLKQERDNLQRVQSDLIMARDKAKVADRQKTDFIHMISHQVKAPLQAISEYTELIVDCMDEEKKKYLSRFADVVKLNTELINSMTSDITEVSALEAKEVDVKIRPASLREICTMAIDSIRPTLPENISIVLDTDSDYTISTDRRRMEQIVTNLLENAVKFSERGTIRVNYNVDPDRRKVDISVSDQGIGIPSDKQEVIFDRFVKLDSSMPGMGLGLYVTRLLTKLLGGEIHVDRSYKGGARFVATFRAKTL